MAVNNNVSKYKKIDFKIGKEPYGSWRKNVSKILQVESVNENVLLVPDEPIFSANTSIEIEDFKNMLVSPEKPTEIVNVLSGFSEISGLSFTPLYTAKTFKNLKPMTIKNEISFTFRYGQAGLFNAFQEVVVPLIALCYEFGFDSIKDGTGIRNPFPTQTQFTYIFFSQFKLGNLFKTAENALKNLKEKERVENETRITDDDVRKAGETYKWHNLQLNEAGFNILKWGKIAESKNNELREAKQKEKDAQDELLENYKSGEKSLTIAGSIREMNEALQSYIGAASQATINSGEFKTLYFRFGDGVSKLDLNSNGDPINYEYGPLTYNNISWEVDTKNLDQYGLPMKGTFKISGISSVERGTSRVLRKGIP